MLIGGRFSKCFPGLALGGAPSAESLIDGMEGTLWSDSNHGRFTMRIETKYWTRELELEAWMNRPEKTLIRIHAPKRKRVLAHCGLAMPCGITCPRWTALSKSRPR